MSAIVTAVFTHNVSVKILVKSLFPLSAGNYWYITSYMLIMLFCDYINEAIETLNKKNFEKLLILMFGVFSFLPTIIQLHIMNDGGKGILNMLLIYFIGGYLRKYGIFIKKKGRFWFA